MTIKILDCTLRDGGYYNQWEFETNLVQDYLAVMAACKIDYVELGLRQFTNVSYLGAHAYTTSQYLNRLVLPDGPMYGAMVDAKTVLTKKLSQEDSIDQLFNDASSEKIGLVRVAAHFEEVEFCLPMLKRLKAKGYLVGLNIMQASLRNSEELEALSTLFSDWDCVDVIYFADSLGSMLPSDMEMVFRAIRKNWKKDIGFHAHNNLGKAVNNVGIAIELGCTWIDGTITGMGRGAGNAETEFLLLDPNIRSSSIDHTNLFRLVEKHFYSLKKSYGWGATVPYYLGALNDLHPTYVQELCADRSLDPKQIPQIIADLGKIPNPAFFDKSMLDSVKSKIESNQGMVDGQMVPPFMEGREVVLVAQTELSAKYRDSLEDYCAKKQPILISINQPRSSINYDLVIISHNAKFRDDESTYRDDRHRYVAPKFMFKGVNINIEYDYGVLVTQKKFKNCGSYARVPNRLTLAYAISFCIDAGAKEINLVGFGGFDLEDQRHKEMQEFLQILALDTEIELHSLTPTTFTIPELSIHAI
ncbi:aldolase catalytic domain-containing protein [bacterium]|nr:aldolase catalytic domain-containing protein [bacterium]